MLIDKFLQYLEYEKGYSSHTLVSYRTDLFQFREHVERLGSEAFDPTKVDSDGIRQWVIDLKMAGEKSSSINRKLSALKSFFKFLKKDGLIKTDPMRKVIAPKKEKRLPAFVKEEEMDDLLSIHNEAFQDDFEGVRDRLIIEMFYTLGVRLSELIGMKNADVDLTDMTVTVLGKGNKERKIPFALPLKQTITLYLERRDDAFSEAKRTFFQKENGDALYPMLVYRMVKRYISTVSTITKKSPHVLRHSFATAMLNNGADLDVVKELLGHANLAATEVYTHTTFEQLQSIYKQAHPRS